MNRRWLARAVALFLVAAASSGCCQAFGAACDCANCLMSGPRLLLAPPAPAPPPLVDVTAPAASPTTMSY